MGLKGCRQIHFRVALFHIYVFVWSEGQRGGVTGAADKRRLSELCIAEIL